MASQNDILDYDEPKGQDVTGTDHEIDQSNGSEINYEITPQNDHSDMGAEASFVPIVSNTDPDLDGAKTEDDYYAMKVIKTNDNESDSESFYDEDDCVDSSQDYSYLDDSKQ